MAVFRVEVEATIKRTLDIVANDHESALKKALKEVERDKGVTKTISANSEFLVGC